MTDHDTKPTCPFQAAGVNQRVTILTVASRIAHRGAWPIPGPSRPAWRCVVGALVVFALTGRVDATTVEGFAEPYQEVDISVVAEPGVLAEVYVREGMQVEPGQVLVKLDTDVLETVLEIARKRAEMRGRIMAAEADVRVRQRYLDSMQTLRADGHATQAELDRADVDLVIAEASLLRAREEQELAVLEVKRTEAQLDRRLLRSPIDGIVTELHRDVGEATQISDPRVVTLVQLSTLRVNFSVTARDSFQLKVGDRLHLALPELGTTVDSEVELVAPVFDAKSGTVKVSCVIDNQEGKYRSGMRCLLELPGVGAEPPRSNQLTKTREGR